MSIVTQKYIRKPLIVEVVEVTANNMEEAAHWCQGKVKTEENSAPFIDVRVHNPKNLRQTRAFVGDFLLYTERGYKVYTPAAFNNSFDKMDEDPQPAGDVQPIPAPEITPQEVEGETEEPLVRTDLSEVVPPTDQEPPVVPTAPPVLEDSPADAPPVQDPVIQDGVATGTDGELPNG